MLWWRLTVLPQVMFGLKRSTTTLQARLGDDSGFADFAARAGVFAGSISFGAITKSVLLAISATATSGVYRVTDSTPANRLVWPDGTNWRYIDDGSIVT